MHQKTMATSLLFAYTTKATLIALLVNSIKRDKQGRQTLPATNQDKLYEQESVMAKTILADFPIFRNQHICPHRNLEDALWDLDALLAVSSQATTFYELPAGVLHRYFSVIADLTKEIVMIYQSNLDKLSRRE
jgi:hypothetical protein